MAKKKKSSETNEKGSGDNGRHPDADTPASQDKSSNEPLAQDIPAKVKKLNEKDYLAELGRLQIELVKLQEWVKSRGLKVVVIFEGRDAAGKGGVHQTHHRMPQPAHLPAWWPCPRPATAKKPNGISSVMSTTCPPPVKSCCWTAAGTTGPGSSASWAFARKRSTRSSCAPARI